MRRNVLVVTTVHRPDDTRIRERLIRTLAGSFDIRYACRLPGPTDASDLEWVPLKGGRLRRNIQVLWLCLSSKWDILILHDPENLIAGLVARLIRRRPVVFDVHEDIPATAMSRSWVPGPLRTILALGLRILLRVAEQMLTVTLAEEGYRRLFRDDHEVFPNFPETSHYPEPESSGDNVVVYLGDVTVGRGAKVAIEACREICLPLVFIGPVSDSDLSAGQGTANRLLSFVGPMSNPAALERISTAAVAISPLLDGPNYRHSQPTKILEYLALGLPVVASDLPGTRQLVAGLEAVYLVPPGDPKELAAGITSASEPSVRSQAIEQAPSIRAQFSWPTDAVTAFYESLR